MLFDETSEGANYLSRLKKTSARPAAGAPPAVAPGRPVKRNHDDAAPPGKATAASAGNRRSPRYKCQGSARVQEVGSATSIRVKLADISMHGCYVEATIPLPAGTSVNLQLEVNGIRVAAGGEVSATYPSLGMGISFTKMADEDRKRLRALMRSISPPSVIVSARVEARPPAILPSDAMPALANSAAALQAILHFFQDRHILGREEFIKILRKSQ